MLAFSHFDKISKKSNYRVQVSLVHGFADSTPWSFCPAALGLSDTVGDIHLYINIPKTKNRVYNLFN